jgi:hypothetical protein
MENLRNRELNSNREAYIKQLQQENQQLKDRINMAIENIEIVLDSYKKSPENALGLNINGLLDLLKGDKE